MNREQLEIPLEDVMPPEEPVEVVVDEELKDGEKKALPPEQDPDFALQQLRNQLETERYARQQAERAAQEAVQKAQKATVKKADTEVQMVESAIKTLKRDTKMLRQAYTDALTAGDTTEAAKINEKLIEAKDSLKDLEKGYKPLKKEAKQAKQEAKAQPQQTYQPQYSNLSSQIDNIISQVTPRSAAWLNANRDSIQNEATIQRMFRAHEDALYEGIQADTDDYFRYIEGRLGMGRQRQPDRQNYQAERQVPPPAAPVNGGFSDRPGIVRLSSAEAEIAKELGMTPKEYAAEKLKLQREGKL